LDPIEEVFGPLGAENNDDDSDDIKTVTTAPSLKRKPITKVPKTVESEGKKKRNRP